MVVIETGCKLSMGVSLRWCRTEDVDEATQAAWSDLGRRAPEPNPFATPEFVLPAARWLTPDRPTWVALIERHGDAGHELVGTGCFTEQRPDLFVPVPHLRSYQTLHTFRSGMLCSAGEATLVAQALMRFLASQDKRWHAITFQNLHADCPVLRSLQEQHVQTRWFERHRFQRPCLHVSTGLDYEDRLRASERKDLQRRQRRLEERGSLHFRVLQGDAVDASAIQTHLQLEHAGWKGKAGTSMLSAPAQVRFFVEMMERFRGTGGAVIAETLCDGDVIASTSNLLLGDTLNGFKTGWHPGYAAMSPGRLNELHLFRQMPTSWPGVTTFDSQSQGDSYLADLLPDRRAMITGTLTTDTLGSLAMRAARLVRPLAYRLERDD